MKKELINILNVCKVAKLLSSLDISFIHPLFHQEAQYFIEDFKKTLDYFNNPMKDKVAYQYSPAFLFDKHLSDLLQTTKSLFNILSNEGKKIIKENTCNSKL